MKATKQPSNNAFLFPTAEHHEKPAETRVDQTVVELPSEDAIDHGVEEPFPASDPVSVTVSKTVPAKN
ncbi:MAG: hypothetical protein EOP82_01750 [Variovorax sp.]|nr:MAG: hypothetical protein EOP82_01750 [Variovorax sp.]